MAISKVTFMKLSKNSERYKGASECISDQLCKMAQLMRRFKFSRNNSQSHLSDYTFFTSSSVKISEQVTNPSCECITSIQYHTLPKIYLTGKIQRGDRYQDSVETSSLQSHNQLHL